MEDSLPLRLVVFLNFFFPELKALIPNGVFLIFCDRITFFSVTRK